MTVKSTNHILIIIIVLFLLYKILDLPGFFINKESDDSKMTYPLVVQDGEDMIMKFSKRKWIKKKLKASIKSINNKRIDIVSIFKRSSKNSPNNLTSRSRLGGTLNKSTKSLHVSQSLNNLGLNSEQYNSIKSQYNKDVLHSKEIQSKAKETHIEINEHLVFRYFSSSEWADKFYDKDMADAIVDTVNWRYDYGVHRIDPQPLKKMIESGFVYTNGNDSDGRPILYFKVRKNSGNEDMKTYLDMLMYSVEMIDRLSVDLTSGEFVCILDLDELSFNNCPPVTVMKEAISLLKRHYPYRLHAIYVVNSGIVFTTIWKLLKPFVPGRVLRKMTFTTSKLDMQQTLTQQIGKENVEISYGGEKSDTIDLDAYMNSHYWANH